MAGSCRQARPDQRTWRSSPGANLTKIVWEESRSVDDRAEIRCVCWRERKSGRQPQRVPPAVAQHALLLLHEALGSDFNQSLLDRANYVVHILFRVGRGKVELVPSISG